MQRSSPASMRRAELLTVPVQRSPAGGRPHLPACGAVQAEDHGRSSADGLERVIAKEIVDGRHVTGIQRCEYDRRASSRTAEVVRPAAREMAVVEDVILFAVSVDVLSCDEPLLELGVVRIAVLDVLLDPCLDDRRQGTGGERLRRWGEARQSD